MNYSTLTELEKIPLRIITAKELALEDLKLGKDLSKDLQWCLDNEQFCGAEGIRLALIDFNTLPTPPKVKQ